MSGNVKWLDELEVYVAEVRVPSEKVDRFRASPELWRRYLVEARDDGIYIRQTAEDESVANALADVMWAVVHGNAPEESRLTLNEH